jgi:hypothetical protein
MDLRRLAELNAYWAQYPPVHVMLGRIAMGLGVVAVPERIARASKPQDVHAAAQTLAQVVPIMPMPADLAHGADTPAAAHRAALKLFIGKDFADD